MDELNVTLVRKSEFTFKPFGKFIMKWIFKKNDTLGTLPVHEISYNSDLGFNYTDEQEKEIVALMKKNKTDVLINYDNKFFSRMGDYIVEINHPKITRYYDYLCSRGYKHSEENGLFYKKGF